MADLQPSDLDFDAFGTPIFESTRTIVDQPATVPVSRERWRYYVDDGTGYTRVNNPIEDNTNSFQDNPNHFLVQCPAGEKRELRTAERATYQSGYEAEWGLAWKAVQNLSDGQVVRVRLIDSLREDGVVAEYRNNNGTIEAEFYLQQASGKINSTGQKSFEPSQTDLTSPRIVRGYSNFYAVGKHQLTEIFCENFRQTEEDYTNIRQTQETKAEIANVDDWSVESFNFHIGVEVDCLNSSNGLDVEVGTVNFKIRADTPETQREKEFRKTGLQYEGTNDNYEPVLAVRVDPERNNVPVDISGTELNQPSGNAGELVAVGVFPDEVTVNQNTGTWAAPTDASANDTVIQVTDDVTEIIQEDGTLGPDIPAVHDSMRTISLAATTSRKSTGGSSAETIKSPVHPDEIMVILLRSDTGQSFSFNTRTISQENW